MVYSRTDLRLRAGTGPRTFLRILMHRVRSPPHPAKRSTPPRTTPELQFRVAHAADRFPIRFVHRSKHLERSRWIHPEEILNSSSRGTHQVLDNGRRSSVFASHDPARGLVSAS